MQDSYCPIFPGKNPVLNRKAESFGAKEGNLPSNFFSTFFLRFCR